MQRGILAGRSQPLLASNTSQEQSVRSKQLGHAAKTPFPKLDDPRGMEPRAQGTAPPCSSFPFVFFLVWGRGRKGGRAGGGGGSLNHKRRSVGNSRTRRLPPGDLHVVSAESSKLGIHPAQPEEFRLLGLPQLLLSRGLSQKPRSVECLSATDFLDL